MPINPGTRPAVGGSSLFKVGDSLLWPTDVGTFLTLAAPTGADYKLTLPVDGGTVGQILTTDGTGITTWEDPSGGVSTFLGLTDTPSAYTDGDVYYASAGALVRLPIGAEDQILTAKSGLPSWEPSQTGGVTTFLGLSDTPGNYAGSGGFLSVVNGAANALEFVDGTTLFDAAGTAAAAVAAHEAAADPHPQYLETTDTYVQTFNGRSGVVVPLQADYDSFFLTPAEGNAAYAPIAHVGDTGAAHGVFTSVVAGFTPASGGGTTNFLRADGTWAAPAGGGAVDSVFGRTGAVVAEVGDYASFYAPVAHVGTGGVAEHPVFTRSVEGFVPAPGGSGTTRYMREDGTWATPAGGGGGGTIGVNYDPIAGEAPSANYAFDGARGTTDPFGIARFNDTGLNEVRMWKHAVPPGYNGGDFEFTITCARPAGSAAGDVFWRIDVEAIKPGATNLDGPASWTTIGTIAVTLTTDNQPFTGVVTGTPPALVVGDSMRVRLVRESGNVLDTLNSEFAQLLGLVGVEV